MNHVDTRVAPPILTRHALRREQNNNVTVQGECLASATSKEATPNQKGWHEKRRHAINVMVAKAMGNCEGANGEVIGRTMTCGRDTNDIIIAVRYVPSIRRIGANDVDNLMLINLTFAMESDQ